MFNSASSDSPEKPTMTHQTTGLFNSPRLSSVLLQCCGILNLSSHRRPSQRTHSTSSARSGSMPARSSDPESDSPTSAFFYGTLMSPAVLKRVTSRPVSAFKTRPALLPDYRRRRVKYADFPAITHDPGNVVRGTYVEGLNKSDVWRLDLFEGDMYERKRVNVRLIKSREDKAARKGSKRKAGRADVLPPGTQSTSGGPRAPPPTEDELERGEVETSTYVWQDPEDQLESGEWDFDEFLREKLWRWAGSQADEEGEYEEVDEAVEKQENEEQTQHDPTRGRAIGGALDEKMRNDAPH